MTWEERNLESLCHKVKSGGTPSTKEPAYYGGEILWLRTQEVNFNFIYDTEIKITEAGLASSTASVIPSDCVIVAMYGNSAGRVAVNKVPLSTNQACCNLLIDDEKADYRFIFYALLKDYDVLHNMSRGAAQNNLNASDVKGYKLKIPPIETQKRIAEILSAYDDLIENNLKRIRLLEESARLLYREWFVRLKFPNHEHTPLIDGLPEGWKSGIISDFYDTGSGGTPSRLNPDYFTGDISWVKTQELKDSFIIDTGEKITEEALKHSAAKLFPAKTVLVAMYGATIGQLGITACPATTNQACCALMPRVKNANYIYAFLFLKENKQQLINLAMGAAQNNINQQTVRNFEMILPSEKIMGNFVEITEPMFKAISNFLEQNQKLKQARDLLLPRLMSGEIAV